jgi:hypothetical protein
MAELTFTHNIPDSVLPYPDELFSRAKFLFWKAISPIFLFLRDASLALHIIHHAGRQGYLLGRLVPGRSVDDFLRYLGEHDFGNNFIALKDEGQILSLRRLENFTWQYHLRIFKDGEVRGHYEYTPEAHPWWHWKEVGMEPRREIFLNIFGGWLEAS